MNTLVKTYPGIFNNLFNELAPNQSVATLPSHNISEDKESFVLELAAPGLSKEDFKIDFHQKTLSISVEKEESKEVEYRRKEFNFNSFKRSFVLSNSIEIGKIEAGYEAGILKITLPKKEEAKEQEPKQIAVA